MTDREMDQVLMNGQRAGDLFDCSHVAHAIEYAQPLTQGMVLCEKSSISCKPQVDVHHQVALCATVAPVSYKRFAGEKHGAKS